METGFLKRMKTVGIPAALAIAMTAFTPAAALAANHGGRGGFEGRPAASHFNGGRGFAARPVTGWGQEGFNYVFNTYYNPAMYTQEPWFDRAHNVFFDWLIAGGFPALLLFLALLISAVVALYRGSASRAERIVLIGALAAYAFQGLFVFDNLFTYIPLAAILALATTLATRGRNLAGRKLGLSVT